jgi:hypothetical protein
MGSKNRFSGSVKKKFYYLCGSIIINNYTFRGNIQNSKHYILKFTAEDTRFIITIKIIIIAGLPLKSVY